MFIVFFYEINDKSISLRYIPVTSKYNFFQLYLHNMTCNNAHNAYNLYDQGRTPLYANQAIKVTLQIYRPF